MSITAEKIARILLDYAEAVMDREWLPGAYRKGEDQDLEKALTVLLQQGEPEGWKLVRRELTGEQMAAAASVLVEEYNLAAPDDCDRLQEMWEAMLSASPLPPAPGAETGEKKLKIDRDWCIDAAKREEAAGDPDCSVGTFLVPPSPEQEEYLDKVKALGTEYDRSTIISSSRQAVLEEAAKLVKSFWITAEYDHIGDADVLESVCAQASEAIRALATPPAEEETK